MPIFRCEVEVEAWAEFGGEGDAGHSFCYRATADGNATKEQIAELIRKTDTVAEVQETLRNGVPVKLVQ